MKVLIIYLMVPFALFISSMVWKNDFCDGWEFGYEQGWCYEQGIGCLTPLIPLCPLPDLHKDTYQDGFNRGFVKGREDYEKD